MMKLKILITCFLVILITGCSELGGDGNPQPTLTTPATTQPANMTNLTGNSEDKEFMEWISVANKEIMVDIKSIMVSAQDKNWTKLESEGHALKNNSRQYLSQIDDYNVSQNMEEVREKVRDSLEDFEKAGSYYESAGRNNSSEDLSNAYGYLEDAMGHLNNASTVLRNEFHSIHTSQMMQ